MSWFKETWWIIKQLFTKVKADKVEYKHMDHYPYSGYAAMSWCGYLLSKKSEDLQFHVLGIMRLFTYTMLRIKVLG